MLIVPFFRSNEAASPVVSDVLGLILCSLNLLKLSGSEFHSWSFSLGFYCIQYVCFQVTTHVDKERVRYFPDDDSMNLQDLVKNEKTRTAEDQNALFMHMASKVRCDVYRFLIQHFIIRKIKRIRGNDLHCARYGAFWWEFWLSWIMFKFVGWFYWHQRDRNMHAGNMVHSAPSWTDCAVFLPIDFHAINAIFLAYPWSF